MKSSPRAGGKRNFRRGRKPKLSQEERAKIVSLYMDGYPVGEISEFFGVSHMTVYRVVNSYFEQFRGRDVDEVFEKVKQRLWS